MFSENYFLSIENSLVLFGLTVLYGLIYIGKHYPNWLTRFYILLYAAPFSGLLGYFFEENFLWWRGVPLAETLISDKDIMRKLMAIGNAGLTGLVTGLMMLDMKKPVYQPVPQLQKYSSTLTMPTYLLLLFVAILFSSFSASEDNLFVAEYASEGLGGEAVKKYGFNSSFLVSYCLVILLYIDFERESKTKAKWKLYFLLIGVTYIVFVHGLLTGDRESANLVVALLLLHITSVKREKTLSWIQAKYFFKVKIKKSLKWLLPTILVFFMLGSLRHVLLDIESIDWEYAVKYNFQANTWTGVLLTNLGTVYNYENPQLSYFFGETYIDYILSLPPSFIAHYYGFLRPMDLPEASPNYWFPGISGGGIHIVNVPFANFGIWGSYLILSIIGTLISYGEKANLRSLKGRLLYSTLSVTGFHWFWYGDMNFVRASIITTLTYVMYIYMTKRYSIR